MNLFDELVNEALRNRAELAPLRVVVEKELLHHEILLALSRSGLLHGLTFIGGTCLRACYGSSRLSEDLDFTGGSEFSRDSLTDLGKILVQTLGSKYGLPISVTEPRKIREGNVDTWKVKIQTRLDHDMMPAQRINIDICRVPSYDHHPALLRHDYGVDLGTSGLIVQAQSREEILADKIVALALRPNRLKNRDIWDIGWLKQRTINLPVELLKKKLTDREVSADTFGNALKSRRKLLASPETRNQFTQEMRRFLSPKIAAETVENSDFWNYLVRIVDEECTSALRAIDSKSTPPPFQM